MPTEGAAGLIFGGPNLDTLFVVVKNRILDLYTAKYARNATDGAGVYAITGVGQTFETTNTPLNVFSTQ